MLLNNCLISCHLINFLNIQDNVISQGTLYLLLTTYYHKIQQVKNNKYLLFSRFLRNPAVQLMVLAQVLSQVLVNLSARAAVISRLNWERRIHVHVHLHVVCKLQFLSACWPETSVSQDIGLPIVLLIIWQVICFPESE